MNNNLLSEAPALVSTKSSPPRLYQRQYTNNVTKKHYYCANCQQDLQVISQTIIDNHIRTCISYINTPMTETTPPKHSYPTPFLIGDRNDLYLFQVALKQRVQSLIEETNNSDSGLTMEFYSELLKSASINEDLVNKWSARQNHS